MKRNLFISTLAVIVLATFSTGAVEVVRNGNFNQILVEWSVPEILGTAIPYSAEHGAANLHPDGLDYSYRGAVLWQPLQVAVSAGDTFQVAVDLRAMWLPPEGKTVAVYLEYLDTAATRHRIRVLNPDNAAITNTAWTTFTAQHSPPAGFLKLVAIAFDKEGDGNFLADNVSVASPRASASVPHLGEVNPAVVPYGGSVVIQGDHFGVASGLVTVGGSTNGVTIQSWSAQQIVINLNDPCAGGGLMVEAAGVRTWQRRTVAVSSPHYVLTARPSTRLVTPGQLVQLPIFVGFRNGFAPAEGIAFSAPGHPTGTALQFSPATVSRKGGTLLTVDTTGLAPGIHALTVRATGGALLPRETTVTLDVRQVGSVQLFYQPDTTAAPLAGATLLEQGGVSFFLRVADTDGSEITWDIPPLPVTSSSPLAVDVFKDPAPWGNNSLLVHASATVVLTATTPDGRTWETALSAAVPSQPAFLGGSFQDLPMINTPGTTNRFSVAATDAMSGLSWGYATLGATIDDRDWGPEAKSFTGTFVLNEPAKPGDYLFNAAASVGGQPRKTNHRLTVVNAPGTGMVRGHMAQNGGEMYGHGASGTLEFYDASTGAKLFEQFIWEWSNDYTAVHLAPGQYKLRWQPEGWGSNQPEPQWYPNASSPAHAATVVVAANQTVNEVNFFLSPSDAPVPPPQFVGPPEYNAPAGVFSLTIQTEANVSYELHKSTSLLDNSWWPVAWANGNGETQILADTTLTGPVGFYRAVRK